MASLLRKLNENLPNRLQFFLTLSSVFVLLQLSSVLTNLEKDGSSVQTLFKVESDVTKVKMRRRLLESGNHEGLDITKQKLSDSSHDSFYS